MVAENCSTGVPVTRPDFAADEAVVVRQLSAVVPPDQVLLTAGEQIERIAAGGAS